MKLLLTDCATLKANGDLSLDTFKQFGEVSEYDNISRSELLKEVEDTDIILCNKTLIDQEVFDHIANTSTAICQVVEGLFSQDAHCIVRDCQCNVLFNR